MVPVVHPSMHIVPAAARMPTGEEPGYTTPAVQCIAAPRPQIFHHRNQMSFCQ